MTTIDFRTLNKRHIAIRNTQEPKASLLACIVHKLYRDRVHLEVVNGAYYAVLKADGTLIGMTGGQFVDLSAPGTTVVEGGAADSAEQTVDLGVHELVWQGFVPHILTIDHQDALTQIEAQIAEGKTNLVTYDDMAVPVRRGAIKDLVTRLRSGNLSAGTEALLEELSRAAA